jgi:hypothetical protein
LLLDEPPLDVEEVWGGADEEVEGVGVGVGVGVEVEELSSVGAAGAEVGRTGEGATLTAGAGLEVVAAEVEEEDAVEFPDGLGTQRLLRERLSLGVTGAMTGTAVSTASISTRGTTRR